LLKVYPSLLPHQIVKETSCLLSFGNKLSQHPVVSMFRLLSHFYSRLFCTAVLNSSGSFDILLAGAFVYISFISLFSWDGSSASRASLHLRWWLIVAYELDCWCNHTILWQESFVAGSVTGSSWRLMDQIGSECPTVLIAKS